MRAESPAQEAACLGGSLTRVRVKLSHGNPSALNMVQEFLEGGKGRLHKDVNIQHIGIVGADCIQTHVSCSVYAGQEVACTNGKEAGRGLVVDGTAEGSIGGEGIQESGPAVRLWEGRRQDRAWFRSNRRIVAGSDRGSLPRALLSESPWLDSMMLLSSSSELPARGRTGGGIATKIGWKASQTWSAREERAEDTHKANILK